HFRTGSARLARHLPGTSRSPVLHAYAGVSVAFRRGEPREQGARMAGTEALRQPATLSLLVTKLHPPPRREQTVARGRLVERLRATPGVKLTVVAAPAGSGKTTLLGAWREFEQETRPVAWLTLDDGDNDPVVLWSYVLAALRSVVPTLDVSSSPERVG